MGGRKWTAEEDALLREVWTQRGSLKVHARKFVNRSHNSLNLYGMSIGLPPRMHLASDRYSVVREKVEKAFEAGFVGMVKDLAAEIGELEREVLRRVKEGHGSKYRICQWTRKKAFMEWVAVYALGTEPDEPKPATQTDSEKKRRYNAKRRAKTGRHNPFAVLISQVTTGEKISMKPSKGSYGSRVHYMDEAA